MNAEDVTTDKHDEKSEPKGIYDGSFWKSHDESVSLRANVCEIDVTIECKQAVITMSRPAEGTTLLES